MKTPIWISYDLEVRGDYEGMYTFLDTYHARECGDSIALLSFEYEDDLIAELKAKIWEYVDLHPRSRIYVCGSSAPRRAFRWDAAIPGLSHSTRALPNPPTLFPCQACRMGKAPVGHGAI